ncbi:MAG: DsbA family oxidoreductase [Bacteroidota bacterium]
MTIDVFADIACPWCYLGERRLFATLAERPDLDATVRWRPFQLQLQLPPSGLPWRPFAEQKFGSWAQAQAGFRHLERAAEDDGVTFDFEGIATAANTADAHRLILFARQHNREWAMALSLFEGYFAEGRDLNDADTLRALAERADLDGEEAAAYLASKAGRDAVAESQRAAQQAGITGVPFTVFDGRLALSGAQPAEVFARALNEARQPATSSRSNA